MSARPKAEPRRVGGMLGRVLRELGHEQAGATFSLFEAWERALGDAAAHAEPVGRRGEVLEVAVASPVWAQHLRLRQTEILRALRGALGDEAPSRLRFQVREQVR